MTLALFFFFKKKKSRYELCRVHVLAMPCSRAGPRPCRMPHTQVQRSHSFWRAMPGRYRARAVPGPLPNGPGSGGPIDTSIGGVQTVHSL